MSKLSNIFKGQVFKTPPLWLMRQAGRYMKIYRDTRKEAGGFLDLCYNPDLASKVTMQPIDRFDFDAAIIFSDILVLPDALGWDVRFEEGEGPLLKKLESDRDLSFLSEFNNQEKFIRVYEAIEKTRSILDSDKSLIGFAGSPWTVASYMIAGRGKHDFSYVKKFIWQNPELIRKLIDIITEATIHHLSNQVKAGADIVQLFDSWAGVLGRQDFFEFVIKPTHKIVKALRTKYEDIHITGFPRGAGYIYEEYIEDTGVDCVGVDQHIPVEVMKKWQNKIIVQGNLDPAILLTNKDIISKEVDKILSQIEYRNFIFNLGHGVIKETPEENVEFLVNYVRSFKK